MKHERVLTIYGIVSIVIMATLLVLVWLRVIPSSLFPAALALGLGLWLGRVILRVLAYRKARENNRASE